MLSLRSSDLIQENFPRLRVSRGFCVEVLWLTPSPSYRDTESCTLTMAFSTQAKWQRWLSEMDGCRMGKGRMAVAWFVRGRRVKKDTGFPGEELACISTIHALVFQENPCRTQECL